MYNNDQNSVVAVLTLALNFEGTNRFPWFNRDW